MSAASLELLVKGKRIPNWSVTDQEGAKHALWDYRQKTHLVLTVTKSWVLQKIRAEEFGWVVVIRGFIYMIKNSSDF